MNNVSVAYENVRLAIGQVVDFGPGVYIVAQSGSKVFLINLESGNIWEEPKSENFTDLSKDYSLAELGVCLADCRNKPIYVYNSPAQYFLGESE